MEQERPSTPRTPRKRRVLFRVLRWLVLWPLVLLILLIVLFYLPPVQGLIRSKAIAWLQEKIGTPVQLADLSIGFPAQLELRGLLVLDPSGDTLLHAAELRSSIGLMALIDGRIEIGDTKLSGVRARLVQSADSTFNFQHIIEAFASSDTTAADTSASSTSLAVSRLQLNDVRFDMDLAPSQLQLAVRLGHLDVPIDDMDAITTRIHAGVLELADASVELRAVAGPDEPDPYPLLPDPFAGLDIAVREIHLDKVAFRMVDPASGDSLALAMGKGDILVDRMILEHQRFHIRSVEVDGISLAMLQRGVALPADTAAEPPPAWLDQHDGFRYWVRGMDVQVLDLAITNGDLAMHQGSVLATERLFDGEHLAFSALKLRAKDLAMNDRSLTVAANEFAATAMDGTQLRGGIRLRATPALVELEEGLFALDQAELRFAAAANIGDPSDAYRQPDRVPLRADIAADIDQATLARVLDQLDIAVPVFRVNEHWKSELLLRGTMRDIDTVGIDLHGDQGSVLLVTASARDVASWPQSAFTLDLRELTMGAGLHDLARAYTPPSVPLPQRFTATAELSGTGSAAGGNIDIKSDLGDVQGTLSATGITDSIPEEVNADLELTNIDVRRLTNDTNIAALNGHVLLDHVRMNGQRTGRIEVALGSTIVRGQDLDSTLLRAHLDGDSVHVDLDATSPALMCDLDAHLRWPADSDTISGAFDLDVSRCHLQELRVVDHPLEVTGRWQGTGGASTKGHAAFALTGDSIQLGNAGRIFRFSEFKASALLASDSTSVSLNSNALELAYHTNVAADSLAPYTQRRLLGWFSTDSVRHTHIEQRANLHVAIPDPRWITDVVFPEVHAIELKEFRGEWEGDAARIDIELPRLEYDGITVSNLSTHIDASRKALDGTLTIDSVRYNAFRVNHLALTAASAPGRLNTGLRIAEPERAPKYAVDIEFQRPNEVLTMHVLDGLILDTLPWEVDPANVIRFTENGPVAEHFVLSHGTQRAEFVTENGQPVVRLDKFDMGALLNIVESTDTVPLVDGQLSGEVRLPFPEGRPLQADMKVERLTLTGQVLGDVTVNARGAENTGYEGGMSLSNGPNKLDANARFSGTGTSATLEAHADIGFTDIHFLQPFVGGVLYDLGGGLKGTVDLRTSPTGKSLAGVLTFTNAFLGVVQTGERYQLRNERVLADLTGFTFDRFTVLDSLGNAIVLDGKVYTEDLVSMRFDLALHTDSFQLASSDRTADQLIYGDLFTSADLRITGTDRAPVVKGDLGILPGTDLSMVLPGSEVELVESEGIVEFTTDLYGTDTSDAATDAERLRDSLRAQLPRIDLDLNIRVDDEARFAIVLDPTTGDQATFRGEGDLRFRYTPEGQMLLHGPFTVSEGGYTLEFYGLVKKRFDLLPGSKVVWDGDPLGAEMDISARYISNSAAYPLVANATGELGETERNRLSVRMPFEVIINIGGDIDKPDIGFAIDLPREYRNSYSKVDQELDRLAERGMEEERHRQVFGLLVFDSFMQDDAAGGTSSSALVTSAARNSVNGILTQQLNKATGQVVKGVDIQLGVSTVDQTQGASTYQQTNLDYKVSKSFLDDRLSFEVGGSLAVDERQGTESSVGNSRAAQYAILYDLTEDGRYRLRGFHENAYDLYDGDITESGVAIMLTRDFEENENAREAAREAVRKQQEEERRRQKSEQDKRESTAPTPATDPKGP